MSNYLPCPVCGKPVEKGDWFLIVSEAQERVTTGTPYHGVPQRPVHLICIQNEAQRPRRVVGVPGRGDAPIRKGE